jgi:hypothetical protein
MRAVLLLGLILAVVAPAQAQTIRAVAVVDFSNISVDSGLIPPAALTEIMRQQLQQQTGGRWRVIAGDSVRAALRARNYTLDDLVYPSRAADVAQALGADWVITGQWTQLRIISRSVPVEPPSAREGDAFAIASVDIRVLDAASRRILLEDRFRGGGTTGGMTSLILAATEALHDAAVRIARL